ncbi:hypothetical protein ADP64_000084 [Achromobacter phage phiAxp-2]|uniref:Uncharacterized protein n=1 Tax=Achromobacter phage phiAxp-2 TaxID=1664246 RepID=A0A0K2FIB7_9CAUD|nr:hypothetical protein ADP64_000084 [Achromobacter phage phiAxp-2]ALA45386.1 hypothetical protein ADP64_000084 [Achromobacter phage phiAxp-2]
MALTPDQCIRIMALVDAYAAMIRSTYRMGGAKNTATTRMDIVNYLQELCGITNAPPLMRWFALKSADNGTDTRMHELGWHQTQDHAQAAADQLPGHTVVVLDELDAASWARVFNLIK